MTKEMLSEYLDGYDKVTDNFILGKDFKPEQKDMDNLVKSDPFKETTKNYFQMDFAELRENVDEENLKHFLKNFDALYGNQELDKSVKKNESLKSDLFSITGKNYRKEEEEDYVVDAMFFLNLGNDVVAKGVLTSRRIEDLFKIYHDMFSEDIKGGSAFYDKLKLKLEEFKDELGHDNWDDIPAEQFVAKFGMDTKQVFDTIENPLYDISKDESKKDEESEDLGDSEALSAYNKLMGDLGKGSPEIEEELSEIKKGNFKLKKEDENGNSGDSAKRSN